ncbi:MAG: Mpo1-like protein [Oleiphilaceae bacterium]|nr:Mpo1-like protein [Oleiphilaceae bacterium]
MRNLTEFLDAYGESHQNPVNQWVHFICVPAIMISALGLLWLIPLGQWLGLSEAVAFWVNGATVLGVVSGAVYLKLGLGVFVLMTAWFALALGIILSVVASGVSLFWSSLAVFAIAWVAQVWGHKVEGKKPSFIEDLVFLLIGPVFVSVEIGARLGLPVPHSSHTS